MNKEIDNTEIWHSEYEIRQFIDMAVRYGIDGVYKSRTENKPFSVFTFQVENSKDNFDKFCIQLRNKLSITNNWKAIEYDIKDRFLPMINQYLSWYKSNAESLNKFEPYNPYALMLSIIESTKNEIVKYFHISDIEKKEVYDKIIPFGLYYESKTHIASINKKHYALKVDAFETIEDFKAAIKSLLHSNNLTFVAQSKGLSNLDFIEAINTQYNLYNYHNPTNIRVWLEHTKQLIMEGKGLRFTRVNDMSKENAFINWYNEKIKELDEHTMKLRDTIIHFYKDDLINNYKEWKQKLNNPLATELQFLEIEKTKCENAISKSKELNKKLFHGEPSNLLDKETNELSKLKIINERIMELTEPQQSIKTPKSIKNKQPTLSELALYHVYLETKINKDNANGYLVNTTHTSGAKLIGNFNEYYKTINRIGSGTDRENNFKLKLFEKVILMLKKTDNKDAISKAENELIQFEKNIA